MPAVPAFDLSPTELARHRPDLDEPDDFEAFWRDTVVRSSGGEPLVSAHPVETGLRLTRTWDVTFKGFGGDPVRAWFSRPAGVDRPLPAVVEYDHHYRRLITDAVRAVSAAGRRRPSRAWCRTWRRYWSPPRCCAESAARWT